MTMPLHEVLERRFGVHEDEFAAALIEFADRAGPFALVDVRPADYFGDAQQSTLRALGASLQPLRSSDLGPIAYLAAAHADLAAHALSVTKLARRLRVDTSRVRQRIYARSLYAFRHQGVWRVPAFQLDGSTLVPGLDLVVSELPLMLHPVAVSRWFTTPISDLILGDRMMSPLEWLSSGGPPEAVAALAGSIDQL